jgi:site-specific recombinase XerD
MTAVSFDNTLRSLSYSLRAQRKSEHTVRQYTASARKFHSWFQGRDGFPAGVTRQDIVSWLAHEQELGLAPASIRHDYAGLSAVFRWLVEEGELETNPMWKVRPPAVPASPKDVVSVDIMGKVLAGLDKAKAYRDAAIISLFYDTGMRVSELAGVRLQDVDWDAMTVSLADTKNNEARTVPFSVTTARRLDRWQRNRGDPESPCLFTGKKGGPLTRSGLLQLVKRTFKPYGLTTISPHDLRHTFATHYLDSPEAREGDLQSIAGWKSPSMLGRYTASTREARAIRAHRRLSPVERLGL